MKNLTEEWHHVFHVMGIPIHVTLLGLSKALAREAVDRAEGVFASWDKIASRFRADSELMHLIGHAGEFVEVSSELFQIIQESIELSRETQGLFDISIGAYLASADYGLPHHYQLPHEVPLFDAIELMPPKSIRLAPQQVIEPAALVKGAAIDEAGEVLSTYAASWMINASGDVRTHGSYKNKKWHVGIQHPLQRDLLIDVVAIQDEALATSGTYVVQKKVHGKPWHHEIDPKTGNPVSGILSLSVIAPTAKQADILSSIAILKGDTAARYLREKNVPFLLVSDVGQITQHHWKSRSVISRQ